MFVTVTTHKGGVGKSTTAIHLAAWLASEYGAENVALVDTDPNESVLDVAARGTEVGGGGLGFRVVGPEESTWEEHVVYDSQGRLAGEDMEAAARESDMLVVPSMPDFMEIRALARFVEDLEQISEGRAVYRVLLTMVPWYERLYCPGRVELEEAGVPLFKEQIETRKVYKHASANGVAVNGMAGRAARKGWEEYSAVGKEMAAIVLGGGVRD